MPDTSVCLLKPPPLCHKSQLLNEWPQPCGEETLRDTWLETLLAGGPPCQGMTAAVGHPPGDRHTKGLQSVDVCAGAGENWYKEKEQQKKTRVQ